MVEGRKSVHELIHSGYEIVSVLASQSFYRQYGDFNNAEVITDADFKKISQFETPAGIAAVAKTKSFGIQDLDANAPVTLVLDGISDPGNLGTLIRTADWYGINQVVMSPDCTDFYNHKALSSSMGSFTRCVFLYTDLTEYLKDKNNWGCYLQGEVIYNIKFQTPLNLVIGSEANGISPSLGTLIPNRITIPGSGQAESLNASVAAAISMDNLYRLTH